MDEFIVDNIAYVAVEWSSIDRIRTFMERIGTLAFY